MQNALRFANSESWSLQFVAERALAVVRSRAGKGPAPQSALKLMRSKA